MNIWILRRKQRKLYEQIVSVYCPILESDVYFTSEGFHHLLYNSNRMPRNIGEQFMKLKCLSDAPLVLKNCAVISETRQIRRKQKGKYKIGFHYELVYEVSKGRKIRVIVEKIGSGKHKFWSVMPHNNASKIKKRLNRKGAH